MKTIQQTLDDLNQINENMSDDEFLEKFEYLTSRKQDNYVTHGQLLNSYLNGTFGKLFRRLDPVAFNASRSDN